MALQAESKLGHEAFRHEALFYRGHDDLVSKLVSFVREGLDAGEAVGVAVPEPGLGALRHALGHEDASSVTFADMSEIGRNPAQIIPFWTSFCAEQSKERRIRAVGQPIWARRSSGEISESLLHEALLNVAFSDSRGLHLICPYDLGTLDSSVVDEGYECHPYVNDLAGPRENDRFRGLNVMAKLPESPLPPSPPGVSEVTFDRGTLASLREWVQLRARTAKIPEAVVDDVVLAVNELATNSIRYGGGGGVCRIWQTAHACVCEVSDAGHIKDPLVGRRQPSNEDTGGRGLWIVNQISDLVQIRTSERGTTVRIYRYLDIEKGSAARATG